MKKKMFFRRSTSLLMSAVLMLGIVGGNLGPFSARQAKAAENITYEPKLSGAAVLPAEAVENERFMKEYVLTSDNTFNCNEFFKLYKWKNITKKVKMEEGNPLSRDDMLWHQDNEGWNAWYEWNFKDSLTDSQMAVLKALMEKEQIRLNYDGNLTSDYHRHIGRHKNKLWDLPKVRLYGNATQLIYQQAEAKDDGQAQHYTVYADSSESWKNFQAFYFNAGHDGCCCGSSKVSQSVIYLSDMEAPYIKSAYAAADKNGTTKIPLSGGFKTGETGYIVLEFNEYIRFGSNNKEALTLKLDAFHVKNDQQLSAGSVTAKLISLKEDKMIFEFSVPQTVNNETTNLYITGISSSQDWVGNNKSFSYILNDKNGSGVSSGGVLELKTTSKITDLAGNGINWSESEKKMNKFYMDALLPSLSKIEISGSDISKASAANREDWPEDIDRSSVFAGVGDELVFSAYFSEELNMSGVNLSDIKAVLNIKDRNGNPVALQAERIETPGAKTVSGVDAFSGQITKIIFKKLTIEDGMSAAAPDGEPIRIQQINGMENVTDLRKNALGGMSDITLKPAQQQYLDTLGAPASTSIVPAQGETEYTPLRSSADEIFTFPVTINDDKSADAGAGAYASGVTGITGSFSLTQEGEAKEFQWYIDTNEGIAGNPYWKSGTTSADSASAKRYELLQMEGANAAYIHIKLDKNTDYNYTPEGKIYFRGNLNIYTKDYAGNELETSFAIAHNSDKTGPVMEKTGDSLSVDYTKMQADITASLKITDNYGIKSIEYYWGEDTSNKQEVTLDALTGNAKFLTEQELSLSESFNFTGDDATRQGSRKLTVLAADINDNLQTWTAEYPYDFRKLTSDYNITESSRENPCSIPTINISLPKEPDGNGNNGRTMLLIAARNGVYYAYHAYDTTDSASVFANMPGAAGEDASSYLDKNHWFRLEGTVTENGGTFTEQTQLKPEEVYQVKQWLKQQYGSVEMMFVTSERLYNSGNVLDSFDFLTSEALVETKTVWLANNIDLQAEVTQIRNEQDESITERLAYINDGAHIPVPTLDGAGFTLTLENLTEKDLGEKIYDLGIIDYTASHVTLNYLTDGKDGAAYSEKYSWKLERAKEQTLLVPQGTTSQTGWYQLKITLHDITGGERELLSGSYFIYTEQVGVSLSEYYKAYMYQDKQLGNFNVDVKNETDLKEASELTIGAAEAPKDWILSTHELVFERAEETGHSDCPADSKIRAWSRADENGESNAEWVSFSQNTRQSYNPIRVEEITKESYQSAGMPVLPLTEGDNVVRYQVMNTNGTIETKEIMLHVVSTVSEFEFETEKTPTQEVIKPVVAENTKLLEPQFHYIGGSEWIKNGLEPYTINSSGVYMFYLYNSYGNLSAKEYEVTDVDGVEPNCWITTPYSVNVGNFDLIFEVEDSVGEVSPKDAYLTFDADYSALLMGLTGEERENNTEQISVNIPVDMEQEDKIWEAFDSQYYGIYRTQVLSYEPGKYKIEVFGTFKYDDSIQNDEYVDRVLTLTAYDKNRNAGSESCTINTANPNMFQNFLTIGVYDDNPNEMTYFDENGNLGVYSYYPFKKILGYGSGSVRAKTIDEQQNRLWLPVHYTSLPMITTDGIYEISYVDLFDTVYTQNIEVDAFKNTDIQIDISNREYTNQDVIVTAKVLDEKDKISSISADLNGLKVEGTLDKNNSSSASIVMTENGTVTVTTESGSTHSVRILNIDKTLEEAKVVYTYNGSNEPEFTEGSEDTVSTEVTAVVQCGEDIDGINGPLTYTFPKGSKKGSEHTFEYSDEAGNTGSITAVLPYDIAEDTKEKPEIDTEPPEFSISAYGMRNDKFIYLAAYGMSDSAEELSEALNQYTAQKYSMIFHIEDDSQAKLLVKKTGTTAPQSFEEESDAIDGVQVENEVITVFNNAEFDVYLIDEAGNVSSFLPVKIKSIDNQAPKVEIDYQKIENDSGISMVRAVFIQEGNEAITSWNSEVHTYLEEITDAENPDAKAVYVTRYYYDFVENGEFTFHYKDIYGNSASVSAEVKGMDTDNPVWLSTLWYGTSGADINTEPSKSAVVNRDITAVLNISKAVNKVNLYRYDESKLDGKGELLTDSLVVAGFTGRNVSVTWSENTDYEIVAEIYASNNGKTVIQRLPAVSCIDKTAPAVTETEAVLSADSTKKTFVFQTDEKTMLSEDKQTKRFQKEHTWTAVNQTVTVLHFTDEAGNVTEYTINVSDVDDKRLTLSYSKNPDGTGAVENALNLGLAAGETVYIMADKRAEITVNDEIKTVEPQIWTAFLLEGEAGFYTVKAVDAVTKRVVYNTLSVQLKDNTAPVITLETSAIHVVEGASAEEIQILIHSGVIVWDDRDGEIGDYTVSGVPESLISGIYELTYTAEDKAGNKSLQKRTLYISKAGAPFVKINGEVAQPFGTTILRSHSVSLDINQTGEAPMMIKWKAGIKTSGQMKYRANMVENQSFEVLEPGFYTIYIRTQNRDEFVTYIYVEE